MVLKSNQQIVEADKKVQIRTFAVKLSGVANMRTYDDGCAAAHALDLVGERWALLVVRELLLGPKRFTDLRAGLPHASPNVLSQRLRELERAGIVRRRKLPRRRHPGSTS
jgi:DNA-binding HxlR family transcriptional regulator